MARRWGLCLFILFSVVRAFAIEATVTHTVFYPVDSATGRRGPVADIYWQINPGTIHYSTTAEKTIVARIRTDIVFFDESGIIAEDHFILRTIPRNNVNELSLNSMIGIRNYKLAPGNINIKVLFTDLGDTTNTYNYTNSFNIPAHRSVSTYYSGIQLLDTIIPSAERTVFSKNGQQQLPFYTNFYDNDHSLLHYYAELYGTDNISPADFPLEQKVFISKTPNEGRFGKFLVTDTIQSKPLNLVSGTFRLSTLPSGNYYLNIALENSTHHVIATSSLFFQRMNTHPEEPKEDTVKKVVPLSDTGLENVTVLNLQKTFLAKYSLAEIRAILKMLLPFSDPSATNTINGFLRKADDLYSRYYIYNYFSAINKKNPEKAWKEFSEKIVEVNKKFNTSSVPGYETERGFMYLRYGAPTDVVTVLNENGAVPYEIWQYNVLIQTNKKEISNAFFLFYRPYQVSGDFRLLHSTVAGEAQNKLWRSFLYPDAAGGNNVNSRAEQYIGNK